MTYHLNGLRESQVLTRLCRERTLFALLICAFLGFFSASVLSVSHFLDLPLLCGGSDGCVRVATHPSSRVAGIPIAVIGAVAYGVIIALALKSGSNRRFRYALLLITGVGATISVSLLVYANQVIRATCPWCVGSAIAMTVLFCLSLGLARTKATLTVPRPAFVWYLAILTAMGVGLQAGLMQRKANTPPIAAQRLSSLTVSDLVDPAKSLGPTNAPVTIIMFADFWCNACRTMYGSLLNYQQAHLGKIRIVYRNLPLFELHGHQYSGTAAALSEFAAEKGKFWEYAHTLHAQTNQLDPTGYLQLIEKLGFDKAEVEARMKNPKDPAILRAKADLEFAEKLGITATPTFILLIPGHSPVSANQRILPQLLNSPVVQNLLIKG